MSNDNEVDMKDVELNEVDQEKQPMTGGDANHDAISPVTEKNGVVKVKIPDGETKFTGLSKEELLNVAGTPGWVRVRWALLILFWLGWLGMLAGAIAIIVQAPRCKPIPEMNWWNYGPLYQIGDLKAFTKSSDIEGLAGKMGEMDQLKVKGLIIGPVHVSEVNNSVELKLDTISQEAGTLESFKKVIHEAHRRGISVVLDLTPNYKGENPWFNREKIDDVAIRVKSALIHWLKTGVDGFLFYGVDEVSTVAPSSWNDINVIIRNQTEGEMKKVLIGVTDKTSPHDIAEMLNSTIVDLLLSGALRSKSALGIAQTVDQLYFNYNQTKLAWNIGERVSGHLASLVGLAHVKLHQLLLLTLPGTPVFNYGDEIGLEDNPNKSPLMVWLKEANETSENNEKEDMSSFYTFFKDVSQKRMKERSLQHGEYFTLFSSSSALAYVRRWDQNERYIIALNWQNETVPLQLKHAELPEQATVVFNTITTPEAGEILDLAKFELMPNQGVMLKFPYTP
ncbi:solute carrier family 3 member 2b [Triplophysa rosa]|uniref:Solute carrier family 3 amino acid transporter heavy chain n=1 Tax=Triplophysa rosa TaxID=992332 RepID=A0A9W7TI53_TRIRA|nr:solute carrier family 3 member 2b [Triplophysa rosa]KAI7796492.1 solute carrier family 3 amino acid transporter heavy chain [Triplophysa rosa]